MKTAIAIILTNVSGGGTPRHAFEMARRAAKGRTFFLYRPFDA